MTEKQFLKACILVAICYFVVVFCLGYSLDLRTDLRPPI